MGKKRVAEKKGTVVNTKSRAEEFKRTTKRQLTAVVLHIRATQNNTQVTLTDPEGDVIFTSSSGALGFRGAKKGTPFAAAKVGELVGAKAKALNAKTARVVVKGTGSGRESPIRAFMNTSDASVTEICDATPIPHGGNRPKKPRRV
ncbi:MAG: 30S ribosomal protein S11 [Candidatus Paceibacterota bacterium]